MATQWFEKAQRQAQAKKAANAGKPKRTFKQFLQRIGKFFKEIRSEFKKVVWPTKKEIVKNTVVVLVVSAFCGLMIWGVDSILALVVSTFLRGV